MVTRCYRSLGTFLKRNRGRHAETTGRIGGRLGCSSVEECLSHIWALGLALECSPSPTQKDELREKLRNSLVIAVMPM